MFRNRTFKVFINLILLAVLNAGQVAVAPSNSGDEIDNKNQIVITQEGINRFDPAPQLLNGADGFACSVCADIFDGLLCIFSKHKEGVHGCAPFLLL